MGGISRSVSDTDEGIASDSESPTSMQSLVQQMQEREADALKWEQKYLEERALRQLTAQSAVVPR